MGKVVCLHRSTHEYVHSMAKRGVLPARTRAQSACVLRSLRGAKYLPPSVEFCFVQREVGRVRVRGASRGWLRLCTGSQCGSTRQRSREVSRMACIGENSKLVMTLAWRIRPGGRSSLSRHLDLLLVCDSSLVLLEDSLLRPCTPVPAAALRLRRKADVRMYEISVPCVFVGVCGLIHDEGRSIPPHHPREINVPPSASFCSGTRRPPESQRDSDHGPGVFCLGLPHYCSSATS